MPESPPLVVSRVPLTLAEAVAQARSLVRMRDQSIAVTQAAAGHFACLSQVEVDAVRAYLSQRWPQRLERFAAWLVGAGGAGLAVLLLSKGVGASFWQGAWPVAAVSYFGIGAVLSFVLLQVAGGLFGDSRLIAGLHPAEDDPVARLQSDQLVRQDSVAAFYRDQVVRVTGRPLCLLDVWFMRTMGGRTDPLSD